jgi:hypothetical protein
MSCHTLPHPDMVRCAAARLDMIYGAPSCGA